MQHRCLWLSLRLCHQHRRLQLLSFWHSFQQLSFRHRSVQLSSQHLSVQLCFQHCRLQHHRRELGSR